MQLWRLYVACSDHLRSPYVQTPNTGFSHASCQIPIISHKALYTLDFFPPQHNYKCWILTVCAERKACDLNPNNSRNKTDQSPSSLQPHCLPGPLIWSHPLRRSDRLGVGIFSSLTYFYFNALENPETFLFYRHALPVALSLQTTR